ncbi:hypothetical protein Bca101_071343 [Brassica carinata]
MLRIVCAKTGTSKCGQRVIVGDVASRAGMKVTEAQKALQALAADTNGFLESKKTKDDVYLKLTIKVQTLATIFFY